MDGSRRRLLGAVVAIVVVSCQPKPAATEGPAGPSPTPASATPRATERPVPTFGPAPTPTPPPPTAPPTSVDLPNGFDEIAWAHAPIALDGTPLDITIGVLGKQATTKRTSTCQPSVYASGYAVLISGCDGATEIVDARTGATISTFDMKKLHLPVPPSDNEFYSYDFARKFLPDIEHGFLYDMSANRDGVQLRRFDLNGKAMTVLATIGPDMERDFWDVDFVLAEDGAVVATACPDDRSKVADYRCRLYEAAPGADRAVKRYLASNSPRPCFLMAADRYFLVGSQYEYCHADGGPDEYIPYMALDRKTLRSQVTDAPSDLRPFGMGPYWGNDVGMSPSLVTNLHPRATYGSPYPAIAVLLGFSDSRFTLQPFINVEDVPEGSSDPYLTFTWALRGRGQGWDLLHAYGPDYAMCVAKDPENGRQSCPSGPEVLEISRADANDPQLVDRYELPPGTWGEIVPPYGGYGF